MSHARMKLFFFIFLIISPGPFLLLVQLLENLVFVEFPRFFFVFVLVEMTKCLNYSLFTERQHIFKIGIKHAMVFHALTFARSRGRY